MFSSDLVFALGEMCDRALVCQAKGDGWKLLGS